MTKMMRQLVEIQGGFKPSVVLPDDFLNEKHNRYFIKHYIPNDETLDIFKSIRDSLQSNAEDRARLFVGTFGTGKSDLMLMIANYLTRSSDDELLSPFFKCLRRLNHAKAESICQTRLNKPPYLLVLLQADTANTFSSFVLNGLAETLEKKNLGSLMGKTYYRAALDTIENWEQNHQNNVERLQDVLEKDYNRMLPRLKTDLRGPRADIALEIFRDAVQKAIGLPFTATAVIKRPVDAFVDIAQKLVSSGQYSGVIIIADEFTDLMEQLAKSPGAGDSKAIDNLAEKAVRSGQNQLHFYVVSLQSFASAQGSAESSQKALERTGGRFSEHSLKSQNTEELISAAIGKLVSSDQFFNNAQRQFDDLLDLTMNLWEKKLGRKDRAWLDETVVRGCFPLHPLSTFCLPRLNQVLAQNERTMFRFLQNNETGLNHFIADAKGAPENGWITLFSVDKLFDYFEGALDEKRPGLKLSYQDASRKLTPDQVEKGLEGRLLRALVMLEIADHRADKDTLRHAIGFPASRMSEIERAITQLEQASVAYPSLTGYYHLVKRGGVDPMTLSREIERLAQTILTSPLNTLNAQYAPNSVEASKYNSQRSTSRQLTARFVSPNELDSPASLTKVFAESDGVLWYVVAHSDQKLDRARSRALQLTRQHNQLVVAVPRQPTDLLTRLQQKHALEKLRQQSDYKTAADLLSDGGMVGKNYITAFRTARRYFDQSQNFDWFRDGRAANVSTPAHLSALASTVMTDVFPATPPHKTKQHLKPKGKSNHLKNAVEQILQAPFNIPAKKKRKSAMEMILLNGAGELGYIYHEKREAGYNVYNICPPDPQMQDSRKIWLLLEEELQKKTSWTKIAAKLSNPPYGLYPSVLQLLLATFYRYNQDYFEIYLASNTTGSPLDITADTIVTIVQAPQNYVFNYQPLYDNQKKFLRGLAERALYPGRPLRLQKGETASLRNRVAKLLRLWSGEKVSIIARQATQEELTNILQKTPQNIISIAVAIMETAMQPQEAATAAALLDGLPAKLELPEDSVQWNEQELDQAMAYLEGACRALKSFHKEFRKHIVQQAGQYFGLTDPFKYEKDVLKLALQWRKEKVSGIKIVQLGGAPDGRDLISVLDEDPYNFEQAFLNALPHRWQLGMFEQWKTIDTSETYLQRLKDATETVEARAVELGVFPTKPEFEEDVTPPLTKPEDDEPVDNKQPKMSQSQQNKSAVIPVEKPESTQSKKSSPSLSPTKIIASPVSTLTSVQPAQPAITAPSKTDGSLSQERNEKTAQKAFEKILLIFKQLPAKEQYILWELLSDEFNPQ